MLIPSGNPANFSNLPEGGSSNASAKPAESTRAELIRTALPGRASDNYQPYRSNESAGGRAGRSPNICSFNDAPPIYLPQNYDQLATPNLAAHLEVSDGKPYAWAFFLEANEPILALQLAEDALQTAIAKSESNYEDLLSCVTITATTFLALGDIQSAHSTIQDTREVVRGKWPENALQFELTIASWAVDIQFSTEVYFALNELVSLFVTFTTRNTDERSKDLCGRILFLLERFRTTTQELKHEVAIACRESSVRIAEHAYGRTTLEVAAMRYHRGQELVEIDPSLAEPHLRRACEILEDLGENCDLQYITVLAQHGWVLVALENWDDALKVANKLAIVDRYFDTDTNSKFTIAQNSSVTPLLHALELRAKVAEGRNQHESAHGLYLQAYGHLKATDAEDHEIISMLKSLRDNAWAGNLLTAEEWALRGLLEHTSRAYGSTDSSAISATADLLAFLDRYDRYQEARSICIKFLGELKEELGEFTFVYINTLRTLSAIDRHIAPKERAEAPLMKALRLARAHLQGDERTLVLAILRDMAKVAEGFNDRSEELRVETLSARYARFAYGTRSLQHAQTLIDRADTHIDLSEIALAEVDAQTALDILNDHPGERKKMSQALRLIGHARYSSGNYEGAIKFFSEALTELRKSDGSNPYAQRLLEFDLGTSLIRSIESIPNLTRTQEALNCFMRAIEIENDPVFCGDDGLDLPLYTSAHQLALMLEMTELAAKLSLPLTRLKLEQEDEDGENDD